MRWCLLITFPNPLSHSYRLVLAEPKTRRVFAERSRLRWRLPRISIPRWSRAAEHVQAVVGEQWGFKAVVIDLLEQKSGHEGIAIAELRGVSRSSHLPCAGSWVNFREVSKSEIDGAGLHTVEALLSDGATGRGAFSRFGWIKEALDWISVEAGIDRARFSGDVKQFNAAADSALVRFGTKSQAPIWFKASGNPSSSEYRVTRVLAQLFPDFLPAVIANREDWKAWAMEDAGAPLNSVCSPGAFGKAVSRLAELKKASKDLVPRLLASGCTDQRLPVLRANIRPLMNLIDDAMARQDSGFAPRLTSARIRALEAILTEACLDLEDLQIPNTLLHGDLSFENILVGPRGLVFTDWPSAAVGNPFVAFEQLRAQIEQEKYARLWLPVLTEIYLGNWLEVLSRNQIECALNLVPPIAAMTYLFDQWQRFGSERCSELDFQSFVRGIARQIDRAAHDIQLRRVRCA